MVDKPPFAEICVSAAGHDPAYFMPGRIFPTQRASRTIQAIITERSWSPPSTSGRVNNLNGNIAWKEQLISRDEERTGRLSLELIWVLTMWTPWSEYAEWERVTCLCWHLNGPISLPFRKWWFLAHGKLAPITGLATSSSPPELDKAMGYNTTGGQRRCGK